MNTSRRTFVSALAMAPFIAAADTADMPALLLAHVASDGIDPTPYLISEKYDGARALWDGRTLRFRSGRLVKAPAWFTANLPRQALDGELWLARGRFDALSGIVRKDEPIDAEWRNVRYMVYELPDAPGSYEQRSERLRSIVDASQTTSESTALNWAPQRRMKSSVQLKQALHTVVSEGGEGLMLHRADAGYVTGRNDALLKLKPLRDAEGVVVAHIPGNGKYAGVMGALQVQTPSGKVIRIGTGFTDEMRCRPPAIGSTITYMHREFTSGGLPRFASFSRIREEL